MVAGLPLTVLAGAACDDADVFRLDPFGAVKAPLHFGDMPFPDGDATSTILYLDDCSITSIVVLHPQYVTATAPSSSKSRAAVANSS